MEIVILKNKLQEMKNALTQRVAKLEADKTRKNGPIEADSAEQAQTVQNDEVIDSLDDMERQQLMQIEAALTRIDNQTYGQCLSCGNQIEEKRLMAMPFASQCMECLEH
jgi:DnaK suppressor protein